MFPKMKLNSVYVVNSDMAIEEFLASVFDTVISDTITSISDVDTVDVLYVCGSDSIPTGSPRITTTCRHAITQIKPSLVVYDGTETNFSRIFKGANDLLHTTWVMLVPSTLGGINHSVGNWIDAVSHYHNLSDAKLNAIALRAEGKDMNQIKDITGLNLGAISDANRINRIVRTGK